MPDNFLVDRGGYDEVENMISWSPHSIFEETEFFENGLFADLFENSAVQHQKTNFNLDLLGPKWHG